MSTPPTPLDLLAMAVAERVDALPASTHWQYTDDSSWRHSWPLPGEEGELLEVVVRFGGSNSGPRAENRLLATGLRWEDDLMVHLQQTNVGRHRLYPAQAAGIVRAVVRHRQRCREAAALALLEVLP